MCCTSYWIKKMTNDIITANDARTLSLSILDSKIKTLKNRLKEQVIRRAYSGEYSASLSLESLGYPSALVVEQVANIFQQRGYKVGYNNTIITLTWN